jgi:hypothetical protein
VHGPRLRERTLPRGGLPHRLASGDFWWAP